MKNPVSPGCPVVGVVEGREEGSTPPLPVDESETYGVWGVEDLGTLGSGCSPVVHSPGPVFRVPECRPPVLRVPWRDPEPEG